MQIEYRDGLLFTSIKIINIDLNHLELVIVSSSGVKLRRAS